MPALPPYTIAFSIGFVALVFLVAVAVVRIPESTSRHWLLLFGVAVFPGLALLLGAGRAMDASKQPSFCGSCHVMGPWIEDLRNPDSKTLAAIHYQNRFILDDQCYTCHTDYGFAGPLRAKLGGMLHMLHYEFGTYASPIELYQPYRFNNCLHCHAESKRYLDAHTDAAEAIADGSMTCLDCHAPVHPEQAAHR
ncbi:MAG TPA: NapC/NirT family cytochrome c [Candidatus Eisenbacteria bacterium]|nr:NapC/NirT family cytochrome c [Candidatus Eisenbacteria bacterium]